MRTAPWCELVVDGRAIGRTPQRLALSPGPHQLRCANPSGARFERRVELVSGEELPIEERLASPAALRPQLSRGDAITVDGDSPSAAARSLSAGRHRIALLAGGRTLEARWLDVPTTGCVLTDAPELRCERP